MHSTDDYAPPQYVYSHPMTGVTVDLLMYRSLILPPTEECLFQPRRQAQILLIKRKNEPFAGKWAFPGGFLDPDKDKDLHAAAVRELQEETSIVVNPDRGLCLEHFMILDDINRDPRGRTISHVFRGYVPSGYDNPVAGDDAAEAKWHPLDDLPPLAFDHQQVITRFIGG